MDTLKSRTIEVNLSDAEVTYISELAAKYDNGSFLQYLLENDELDRVLSACRSIEVHKSTITKLENELASGEMKCIDGSILTWKDTSDSLEEWEKREKDCIEDAKNLMKYKENIIKDFWNDYKHKANSAESLEDEMKKIMEYQERYEYLLG